MEGLEPRRMEQEVVMFRELLEILGLVSLVLELMELELGMEVLELGLMGLSLTLRRILRRTQTLGVESGRFKLKIVNIYMYISR